MVFNTCFVGRIQATGGDGRQPRSYICCRFDPVSGWKSPPAENLLAFCFPLGVENVRPREYMRPEEFSFTLTAGDGSRLHGFCRRTLPPHKAPAKTLAPAAAKMAMMRYPQVLCIVSPHPWFPFFYKVLELVEKMLRQEDLGAAGPSGKWPPASPAAMFLGELLQQVPAQPTLGTIVRVRLPQTELPLDFSPPRRAVTSSAGQSPLLRADAGAVELEVPPNLGLGNDNAGIAAARLLFHLPPRVTLTLIASLLLERRIILVASAEDKVSAAVHAAAALLHPFRWQHIYLPLLPMSLKDYLAAPMPYLVGLNSDCLPMLRTMPLEEVLLVDLDLGECSPPPDSARDDAFLLPYASRLLSALETCKDGTLSATEFNSTPFIASVMQEYFLKLGMARYRQFMQPDVAGAGQRRPLGGPKNGGAEDTMIRVHGYAFDLAGFVEQHKNAAVRDFLQQFRHSQMFEVFITERLRLAEKGETPQDAFEEKVSQFMSRQASMFGPSSMMLGQHGGGSNSGGGGSKFAAMLKKTANAMRQSSDNLMKGLKSLGPSQQEEYVSMPKRANTSFSLQRVSPVGGLHAGHSSRTPSLTQGSRVPSFSDMRAGEMSRPNLSRPSLGRPSPLPRGKAGAVSLEDVKPDVFFGDDDDTDAVSEMSEGSSHPRSGNSSPGPLEQGAFRNKTFSALFRLGGTTSQSAAPSPRHAPALAEQIGGGKSSSSPSLVSLDVKAGGAPQLVDLLSGGPAQDTTPQQQQQQQYRTGQPSAPVPVAGPLPQAPAALVRPYSQLGTSGGSGCFGSPVGPPPPRRLTNMYNSSGGSPLGQDSPLARGGGSHDFPAPVPVPSGDLTSAILGALSSHPAPSRLARHSTGSAGNELTSLTSFYGAAEPQPMVSTLPQHQQQSVAAPQQPRAPIRGNSLTLSMSSQGGDALPSPGPLSSRMAVKADPFGGLLAGAVTAVSEDLAVRKRTSSAGSGGGGLPAQEGSGSWADFTAASMVGPAAGGTAGGGGEWAAQWPAQGALPAGDVSSKGGLEVSGLAAQLAAECTVGGAGLGRPGAQVNAALQRKRTSTTDEWGAFI